MLFAIFFCALLDIPYPFPFFAEGWLLHVSGSLGFNALVLYINLIGSSVLLWDLAFDTPYNPFDI